MKHNKTSNYNNDTVDDIFQEMMKNLEASYKNPKIQAAKTKHYSDAVLYQRMVRAKKDSAAMNEIVQIFEHTSAQCVRRIYSVFGATALETKGRAIEDYMQEARLACVDAVRHWDYEKVPEAKRAPNAIAVSKQIHTYVRIFIDGALKDFVFAANNITPYYGNMYVAMRRENLDLYKDPDDVLLDFLRKHDPKIKDHVKLLNTLRDVIAGRGKPYKKQLPKRERPQEDYECDLLQEIRNALPTTMFIVWEAVALNNQTRAQIARDLNIKYDMATKLYKQACVEVRRIAGYRRRKLA